MRRKDVQRRDQARLAKSRERLLTADQESLITLEESSEPRAPEFRKQQQAIEAELQSLEMAAVDQTRHLRLEETLADLRTRLRARANALAEAERQRVVRLLVHEILVGRDSITIRHSIPMPALTPDSNDGAQPTHEPPKPGTGPCYLLHSHSQRLWNNVSVGLGRIQKSTKPNFLPVLINGECTHRKTKHTCWFM